MITRQGRLFVLSASSGTGKTTLAHRLRRRHKNLMRSVSYTTRTKRPNEVDGRDYTFVTRDQFLAMRRQGAFLEWARVFSHWYGTPRQPVHDYLQRGLDVLLVIDVQGAKQVKRVEPTAVCIFLAPPSRQELKKRLEKRGVDSRQEIGKRLTVAEREWKESGGLFLYDYRIVNRDIEKAAAVLQAIIRAERRR